MGGSRPIDEAQKKIDGLTSNVVSLQELLVTSVARRFREVQLEGLVRNILPPTPTSGKYTLSNGNRATACLRLPEPTGWWRSTPSSAGELSSHVRCRRGRGGRAQAQRQFKLDVKRHVDAIHDKYIMQ